VTAPRPRLQDAPEEFDGCSRECRKAREHTHVWGRCAEASAPTPPSKDDLRGLLIAARLTSHVTTAWDGQPSIVMHSDEEAADRALAVFKRWLFGTPEEIAARKAEVDEKQPDDPAEMRARIVGLCEKSAPGEHERRAREQVAAEYRAAAQAIEDSDGMNDDPLTDAIWAGAKEQRALNVIDKPTALAVLAYRHLADRIAQGEPAGARLALVTADDLAEILDYVVGDGDVRVVRNETLDRAFAALKATLPRGEVR
jgi:hypothetical protein